MPTPLSTLAYIDPTGGLPPSLWGPMLAAIFAPIIAVAAWFRITIWAFVKRHVALTTVVLLMLVVGSLMAFSFFSAGTLKFWQWGSDSASEGPAEASGFPRVLILGFDGMDPRLVDKFLGESRLPNLARMAHTGIYHTLQTVSPPQSPVAWSSFITGTDAAHHGIFDFIKRDPTNYMPDLSLADRQNMSTVWQGTPFWQKPTIAKLGFVGLRFPMVFPPDKLGKINGRILAGMGVWDVRGTEGTYFFYSTKPVENPDARGKILALTRDGSVLKGAIPGPYTAGGADDTLEPFTLTPTTDGATLNVSGKDYPLTNAKWSDFVRIEFRLGALGLRKIKSITRVLLKKTPEGETTLYVSPPNFDPSAPAYTLSNPTAYSADLVKDIGPYVTRGMPFDSQALTDGCLNDDDFLGQVDQINAETKKMLGREMPRFKSGVLFAYFEASDMVQHMYWRGIDPENALYNDPDTQKHKDAILEIYEQLDAVAGRAMEDMGNDGAVVVISDHGFGPFRQSIHLNTVLRDLGYLTFKTGKTSSDQFFADVDWSKTKAYALGFNSLYINLKGREGQGIVEPSDAATLADNIARDLEGWKEPTHSEQPIKKIRPIGRAQGASWNDKLPDMIVGYKRGYRGSWETALGGAPPKTIDTNAKKWSGDHCVDASEVPGIFLSSDRALDAKSLADVGSAVEAYLAAREKAAAPAGAPAPAAASGGN